MYNLLRIGIQGTERFRACSCPGQLKLIVTKNYAHALTGAAINLFVVTLNWEQSCASVEDFCVLSLGFFFLSTHNSESISI